jgi:DNA-binding NtrC family response regulator
MQVLIVENDAELGRIWQRHLERQGAQVELAGSQSAAIEVLRRTEVQVIVLNLDLAGGSAFAIADFASYRWPKARVIFVNNTSFFSDGSIFALIPNACAQVQAQVRPDDLAAMVEHYGSALQ